MLRTRRYLNTATNLLLLGLLVASFVTGWVASLLGLSEFGFHKYTSIGLFLAAGIHVVLHGRTLRAQLRTWCRRQATVHLPAQPTAMAIEEGR